MGFRIQILSIIIGIIFFLFILRFIRKSYFSPGQTVLWILLSLFLISIPLLESFYKWIATDIIGINDARHIIYIFIIGFLLIYVFYLSSKVTALCDQVKHLISKTAIMKKDFEQKH